jgi:hypothetical protein
MTQEEIRKLLGGYAANTLTESERTALFEAALEDQNLFDALQNEDTLRDLLSDPVSREQIRQVLKPTPRRTLWMQPWLIGTATVAVAAVIAIAIVTRHREPAATSVPTQIAQSVAEPKLEAPPTEARQPEAPQPAPAVPAPERKGAAHLVARSAALAARPAAALALQQAIAKQEPTTDIANASLYTGPLVRYAVLRSGPSGDAIRIQVVSELAGNLALYRMDAGGQWQRVFPASGPGFSIAANTSYQVPNDPIAIRGDQDKLRLVIEPAARATLGIQLSNGALAAPRADALEKTTSTPTPLVIEIPIGPN